MLDIKKLKKDFPIFSNKDKGKVLHYLDNGATTQKPFCVIKRITDFYSNEYATIHRGVYPLSQNATIMYDAARKTAQNFLGARFAEEIIFTKGTTEAINLVVESFGNSLLKAGQEILISEVEHHANFVPWQQLCQKKGLTLKLIPVNDNGELEVEKFKQLLSSKTGLVTLTQVSNVLGSIFPVKDIIALSHQVGARVLIDGAQAVAHIAVNVQELDCDFYAFSGHKIYGPTGVGVLYGKKALLEKMTPYQFGGDMIENVSLEKTTFASLPNKFEAGTPPIASVLGMAEALKYVKKIGLEKIAKYEHEILKYATVSLRKIEKLRIIGQAKDKASLISFIVDDIHPHDIGTILGELSVAIRVGHHCSQPTMKRFGVEATARASFGLYNDKEDVDCLVESLIKAIKVLK